MFHSIHGYLGGLCWGRVTRLKNRQNRFEFDPLKLCEGISVEQNKIIKVFDATICCGTALVDVQESVSGLETWVDDQYQNLMQ